MTPWASSGQTGYTFIIQTIDMFAIVSLIYVFQFSKTDPKYSSNNMTFNFFDTHCTGHITRSFYWTNTWLKNETIIFGALPTSTLLRTWKTDFPGLLFVYNILLSIRIFYTHNNKYKTHKRQKQGTTDALFARYQFACFAVYMFW